MRRPRDHVPFACDAACQRFVAEHPDGATLDELGKYFGVTRERIRQIQCQAIRKLHTQWRARARAGQAA